MQIECIRSTSNRIDYKHCTALQSANRFEALKNSIRMDSRDLTVTALACTIPALLCCFTRSCADPITPLLDKDKHRRHAVLRAQAITMIEQEKAEEEEDKEKGRNIIIIITRN